MLDATGIPFMSEGWPAGSYPSISALAAIFVASVMGSPHCAGMCGCFVAFYAGNSCSRVAPHVGYNLGRLTTYLILGVVCALIGRSLDSVGAMAGFSRASALLVGILMIVWGLGSLLVAKRGAAGALSRGFSDRIGALLSRLVRGDQHERYRAYLLGCLTTLLPCGWLYAFLGLALASGSVASAIVIMSVFWLGTLPMMLSLGIFARQISLPLRRHVPVLTAILLLLAGVFSLYGSLAPGKHHKHHHMHTAE